MIYDNARSVEQAAPDPSGLVLARLISGYSSLFLPYSLPMA